MSSDIIDPVCGMAVPPEQHGLTYRGMHFAFCSEQCRERFLRHPGLYVGYPGWRAIKAEGQSVIKRRRIRLEHPLADQQAALIRSYLATMMGIQEVVIRGTEVEIVYDLLQATAEQIENALGEAGAELGSGWSERLRRAFVHYKEETESETLGTRPFRNL